MIRDLPRASGSSRGAARRRSAAALAAVAVSLGVLACGRRLARPAGDGASAARAYVATHRDALEREIRVGSGRSIYGLATVAGCQDSAQLGRVLHQHHSELFPPRPRDAETLAEEVVWLMSHDPASRCLDLLRGAKRPFAAGRHDVVGQRRGAGPVMRELSIRRFDPPDR